jgi:hypothetical protein
MTYLVTPDEACVAMNLKLRHAHCQHLQNAFDWDAALEVDSADVTEFRDKVHIIETTADGTFMQNYVGLQKKGPFHVLKNFHLPPGIAKIQPQRDNVLHGLEVL